MTYEENVKDVFIEHHISQGFHSLTVEEAEELFNEYPFSKIEKWLIKIGYDLTVY